MECHADIMPALLWCRCPPGHIFCSHLARGDFVLSSPGFLHLPIKYIVAFQVRENLKGLDVETEALAEISLCCGFFLIYLIEEIVHICIDAGHGKESDLNGNVNWYIN